MDNIQKIKTETSVLTAEKVHEIMLYCLYDDDENRDGHIAVDGVLMKVGFHPKRLEEKRQEISDLLDELPSGFFNDMGGGQSFLNMCVNKNGTMWTDMHATVDELVCLGIAIGRVRFCVGRELWGVLPGGVPYISISR